MWIKSVLYPDFLILLYYNQLSHKRSPVHNLLQVWLLSSSASRLSEVSFLSVVDMTYDGVVHFLTFSAKPAGDIEQSLGKMFMSLVALVFGVSACYRTLKRGAVQGQRNEMRTRIKEHPYKLIQK